MNSSLTEINLKTANCITRVKYNNKCLSLSVYSVIIYSILKDCIFVYNFELFSYRNNNHSIHYI